MIDVFKQFGDWHVRHKGEIINLNTKEAGQLLLSLFEQVESLEAQVHKRGKRRVKETVECEDQD